MLKEDEVPYSKGFYMKRIIKRYTKKEVVNLMLKTYSKRMKNK